MILELLELLKVVDLFFVTCTCCEVQGPLNLKTILAFSLVILSCLKPFFHLFPGLSHPAIVNGS